MSPPHLLLNKHYLDTQLDTTYDRSTLHKYSVAGMLLMHRAMHAFAPWASVFLFIKWEERTSSLICRSLDFTIQKFGSLRGLLTFHVAIQRHPTVKTVATISYANISWKTHGHNVQKDRKNKNFRIRDGPTNWIHLAPWIALFRVLITDRRKFERRLAFGNHGAGHPTRHSTAGCKGWK